jgi:hypothetical protein
MARQAIPAVKPAEWTPDRSVRELNRLVIELDELDGKNNRSGADSETSWKQKSVNVFSRAFSSDSANHRNLMHARSAGSYTLYGGDDDEQNYRDRLSAYRIAMSTAIDDLRMSMPELEIRGVYEGGDEYQFCRDLRTLFQGASTEVFVIDPYLDGQLFDLYVDQVNVPAKIRILTSNLSSTVLTLAQKFASGKVSFELRTTPDIHDRAIFIDDRCWVVGQSIKDAAKKKPTYVVEHDHKLMRPAYEATWANATHQV